MMSQSDKQEGFGRGTHKLSPAGERNIVVLMLGGAKSPTEFMINVVGGKGLQRPFFNCGAPPNGRRKADARSLWSDIPAKADTNEAGGRVSPGPFLF